jgi:hypothetical protein
LANRAKTTPYNKIRNPILIQADFQLLLYLC